MVTDLITYIYKILVVLTPSEIWVCGACLEASREEASGQQEKGLYGCRWHSLEVEV